MLKRYLHDLKFDIRYLVEEILLKIKHPKREGDISYYNSKFWNTLIFHPVYCFRRGIRNLISYFSLIWKTDVWDYYFLTELIDKKLEEMERFWLKKAIRERESTNSDISIGWRCQDRRKYKRIKWTRRLYNIWNDEEYTSKWYKIHKAEYPETSLFEKSEVSEYDEFGVPILYKAPHISEEASTHYSIGSENARKMEKKAYDLYFKNLTHLNKWWD